jgi:hypothetical protein
LNDVNVAIELAVVVCNRTLAFKKQIAKPLHDEYVNARQRYMTVALRNKVMGVKPDYNIHADFRAHEPPKVPMTMVERFVLGKVSIRGRALAAAMELMGAVDDLEKSIELRNELIAETQKAGSPQPRTLVEKYFGLRTAEGIVDNRYRSNVEAIIQKTDDCIFFSHLLADDLLAFGSALRKQHARRLRTGLPQLTTIDWSHVIGTGLIPSKDTYKDWLKGFPTSGASPRQAGTPSK